MAEAQADSPKIRIGLVDDDAVLARALIRALAREADFELVGSAESLDEGRDLVARGLDILLVDLGLPDGSGLELIERARRTPATRVLVFSVFGDGRTVVDAIERGAHGYVLKGSGPDEAIAAIRAVLAGGAPISPAVAGHILSRVRGLATPKPAPESIALTPRETAVLEQLAKGLTFKEVARVEGISHHTVSDHVKAIYRKLSVSSRGEAVFEAIQTGLLDVRR